MNQNFSKSKSLLESSKLEHFQLGVQILDLFKSLDFQQSSYSWYFGLGVKIYQIVPKRSMVISTYMFQFFCDMFQSSNGNLLIMSHNVHCTLMFALSVCHNSKTLAKADKIVSLPLVLNFGAHVHFN